MKKIHYLTLVAGITMVMLMSFGLTEDPFLEHFKTSWKQYAETYPEEKVYLQIDKPFYKPGETIWFNSFLVNSNTHKPSAISDVVYVTLKDPKGNVQRSVELFVQDGTSRGDFTLGDDAVGGIYTITAYTKWMQNFGEESLFSRTIQVQKVITPRLLLTLDFEKEAYGKGDEVIATLKARDLQNNQLANAKIKATIKINGQQIEALELTSGPEEKTAIKFSLPENLQTTDGLLQVIVDAQGLQESISRSIPIVLNQIKLSFFPEGGNIIEGAETKIAFIASNEFSKGADVTGEIIDDRNQVITSFESFHMGMGAFTIKPEPGRLYYARITKPSGNNEQRFKIPNVNQNGLSLSMSKVNDQLVTAKIYSPNETVVFLIGKTHNEIYYATKLSIAKGFTTQNIDAAKFPVGIVTFTLFNAEGLEEAERLVFMNSAKTLNVKITTDKKNYLPSEKVNLKITTTDANGKAIAAKLSLAVVDDQIISFADDKQDNILSWFLMSSELKGEIQEPSFYFDKKEPKSAEAMDYLLLTHGWRRYNWKDVLKNDRSIVFVPENNSNISGAIKNLSGNATQAEVVLLELGNRRRIAKVKSTQNGQFVFKNIDASIPMVLMTKSPNQVQILSRGNTVQTDAPFRVRQQNGLNYDVTPTIERDTEEMIARTEVDQDIDESGNLNLRMDADVTSLQEVVVTGYAQQSKNSLTATIATVRREDIATLPNVQNALQGRVAGISITPSGSAGSASQIRIRGVSSLHAGSEPLYVIDNYPLSTSINSNDNPLNFLNPNDIESISIMHSPESAAIYGSAAANGVIIITTKSKSYYSNSRKLRKPKYTSLTLQPRKFNTTKDFFTPEKKSSDTERKNFNTTVYWNSSVVTDQNGNAEISFVSNDAASAFRITAEGIAANGLIGRTEEVYSTQLPFSIDVKIPEYLSFEDTLQLPIMIKNITSAPIDGTVKLTIPKELRTLGNSELTFKAEANQTKTLYIPVVTTATRGRFPISLELSSRDYHDRISQTIDVFPNGFPMTVSYSGKDLKQKLRFDIGEFEKGSLQASINVYTDVMTDLFSGAEGILQEPHGCFEQTSSSTYPNILALQFLKESGQIRPEIEQKATRFISMGYGRLVGFEVKGGGFDWFGNPPAHEGLTAYGLLEFYEMQKVYGGVDEKLIARTKDWLLALRNGDGTFKQHPGKYGFSNGATEITNAYIVFALAETGSSEILQEYGKSLEECWKSKDLYRMALMANAAYSLGKKDDYEQLTRYYETAVANGFDKMNVTSTMVRSYGQSLEIETVALWSAAMMKSIRSNLGVINRGIQFILSKRSGGRFGSTQATILSLKALTLYAQYTRTLRSDGDVIVTVNNSIDKAHYTSTMREKITMQDFSRNLRAGNNLVEIAFEKTKEPLPYSLDVVWNSKTPASSKNCSLKLTTTLSTNILKRNETVRLSCEVSNMTKEVLPMSVALIAIPAGLSAQPWQLKELQEKGLFDFYEIMGNKIAFYYRGMSPHAVNTINLDLKAEINGSYESAASCVYLYYANEFKHWVKGTSVRIF